LDSPSLFTEKINGLIPLIAEWLERGRLIEVFISHNSRRRDVFEAK